MIRECTSEITYQTTENDTIFSLLRNRVQRDPHSIVAQVLIGPKRQWVDITAQQMMDDVRACAKGLLALGIEKGDTVLIYAPTSYEWGVVDFACAAIGAISVPVYDTDSPRQVAQIVEATTPEVTFAGGEERALILENLRHDEESSVRYSFNIASNGLNAVKEWGKDVSDDELNRAIDQVKSDDPATIIFTSGSTGTPKGALLSSRNFTHTVYAGYDILPSMLGAQDSRLLLFLPLAHAFARYIQFSAVGRYGTIGYLSDTKHLLADLRGFKPTYLLAVPRVFEKVYNAASQKAGNGIKGHIFNKAVEHFVKWSKDEQNSVAHGFSDKMLHRLYMKTVGDSIHSALGNNLRSLACGGAPMNEDLGHFYNGIDGIEFIQGYGLTETAAPCIVNFEAANRVGSVGRPAPGFTARLSEDDELEVAGPSVFMGYYKNPEQTREVLDGQWLKTGDLASIDDDGFVYITGRKKDVIITAGGKNVSPAPIEDIINTCPIVSAAVVVGDNKPFISALITLESDMLRVWLEGQGLDASMTPLEAAESDAVKAFIQEYIDRANTMLSRAESVRKFVVLPHEFSQEQGMLTPSMKIVRPQIIRQYSEVIEKVLYAPKPSLMTPAVTAKIFEAAEQMSNQVSPTISAARERLEPMYEKAVESVNELSEKLLTSASTVTERLGDKEVEPVEDLDEVSPKAQDSAEEKL